MPNLPSALRALREQRGLTPADVAARVGCAVARIYEYEAGRREPRWSRMVELAAALEVDVTRLAAEAR